MKKEKQQLRLQKNRTNKNPKNTINNYKLTNWTTYKRWTYKNCFSETYSPQTLNQEGIDSLNRLITRHEIKCVMNIISCKQSPGQHVFTAEFYQTY